MILKCPKGFEVEMTAGEIAKINDVFDILTDLLSVLKDHNCDTVCCKPITVTDVYDLSADDLKTVRKVLVSLKYAKEIYPKEIKEREKDQ